MSTDHAFIAAYGIPVTPDSFPVPVTGVSAGQGTTSGSGTSTGPQRRRATRTSSNQTLDAQYQDATWYRLDDRHDDAQAVAPPHTPPAPRQAQPASPAPTPVAPVAVATAPRVEAAAANVPASWDWQSSCLVMASPVLDYPELPTPPASRASAVVAKVSEPEVVAEPAVAASPAMRSVQIERESRSTSLAAPEPVTLPHSPSAVNSRAAVGTGEVASLPQPPAVTAAAAIAGWTPQWEVDDFAWPEEVRQLQEEQAEYFRYAGEKLRDASREGLKTLAVVATRGKEGCTTMAVCLARAAAIAGARVALLDANLDHPELGPKLGIDFSHGWQEALSGNSPLAEAAILAVDSGLTLLPLSTAHRLTALTDPRITWALREASRAFDLVIVDAGVAPAGEAALFEGGAQCPVAAALVIRDLRRTSETETLVTASRLKSLGIEAIGIAENFTPRPEHHLAAA